MEGHQPFTLKPWMWALFFIGLAFLVLNYDPVGDLLTQRFGLGAEKWATNIIFIGLILYTFIPRKKKDPPPPSS